MPKTNQIRNSIEHPNNPKQITNPQFGSDHQGNIWIELPRLIKEQYSLHEYMEVTLHNVLTFIEDYTVIILSMFCHEFVHIVQLPETVRSEYEGCRYIITLKDEIQKKFIEQVSKEEE